MLGWLRLPKPTSRWGAWSPTPSPATGYFWINPPFQLVRDPLSQLVFGYHWLAFLNQVCKIFKVPNSLRSFSRKLTIYQKSKNLKISDHSESSGTTFLSYNILKKSNDHISKTKNRKKQKIDLHSFQNIAQLFRPKSQFGYF